MLSARQLEVAKFVASGNSTREIADKLALSPRTVETHIATIFEKLGIRSRSQLAAVIAGTVGEVRIGNLPAMPHPLVGRTTDISAIARLLAKNAIVTILGTGGIGKTQTSIRIAADAQADYDDGVWFVEFASLTSGDDVAFEIARVVDPSHTMGDDVLTMLANRLKNKRMLLVFDNCEHVIGHAANACAALVRACTGISILATSREPLGISGEVTYRLPALAPKDARALFIERTQAIDHRIVIDDEANRAIDSICRRLDGIPLAIELAAARTNVFSPTQLLQRLESRLALLDGGRRDVLPRHKSIDALIDWSYDQLDDRDRQLFRRLSIFPSRFTLEAAHAISALPFEAETAFLNAFSSLINKSLVVAEPDGDELSYRLLESTRLYARSKLDECAETHDLAQIHARYLARTLQAITTRNKCFGSQDAIAFFRRTLADLRAALAWGLRSGDVETGADLLVQIHYLWSTTSAREGIDLIEKYLAALDAEHASLRARLLSFLAEFHWRNGQQDRATETSARAVIAARRSGDESALGHALVASAGASVYSDPENSWRQLREAEALADTTEIVREECRALRARLTYLSDDFEEAIPMYRRLIEDAELRGDTTSDAQYQLVLALIEHRAGRHQTAVGLAREAVARIGKVNERWALALYSSSLATLLVYAGALREAREVALDTLMLYAEIDPENARIGAAAATLGYVFAVDGDFARAAQFQGAARAIFSRPGITPSPIAADLIDRCDAKLRDALCEDELRRVRGVALNVHDLISLVAR